MEILIGLAIAVFGGLMFWAGAWSMMKIRNWQVIPFQKPDKQAGRPLPKAVNLEMPGTAEDMARMFSRPESYATRLQDDTTER